MRLWTFVMRMFAIQNDKMDIGEWRFKNISILMVILILGISCRAQNRYQEEEKNRLKIRTEFSKSLLACNFKVNAVTKSNGRVEFWSICNVSGDKRIIKIAFYERDTYYEEIYFDKKGMLVYAKEAENYIPENSHIQKVWNCEFFIENRNILTLMSLGHGKTENDEWEPEEIFEMYKRRLIQLEQLKQ